MLIDCFGRRITYLRLSVTDRCDLRCRYCMAEDMTFLPRAQILTLEELYTLARVFVGLGVEKIRVTGGEPLVRRGGLNLIEDLGRLPLRELTLTTNGMRLAECARRLAAAGVRRLNVSLDSLDPKRFRRITRVGDLEQVLQGIEAARRAGFQRIKLNTVVLKGVNHDETTALVRFAVDRGLDISFIEEMPLGVIGDHDRAAAFYASDQVRADLERHFELLPTTERTGGPSRYWRVAGSDTRVGFISPHSHNFCGDCNRVRLTVEGRLLLCLGNEHSLDLRRILRRWPGDEDRLRRAIREAIGRKPERHHFDLREQPVILRHMNHTGG
ncbi:GTP 3',8-cyclase [Methylomarinovum caldicuralii]|uniref:GTP 3',8-cyclase n=1 Tax=Methylomarinovum caldicuralii TaxID=438856 RepID=A0AAU9CU20_9GAMM|nr:GTP 3',8-cyclase MoaA [Methylomarinovum caldicuralii]BCX81412.1 GTP 3',8-cyclase [Methylomarinovum caldicuralii]